MAFDTEAKIKDAVKIRENELNPLIRRFDEDFELWRLKEYTLGKEYDNYTSNKPRTLANKIVDTLAHAPIQIKIPLEKDNEEERNAISDAERFIYGSLNLIDSRFEDAVLSHTQEQLAFYSVFRGWYGLRAFIGEDDDGNAVLHVAIWDIFNTTWRAGDGRMLWVCHKRSVSKDEVEAEYKVIGKKKNIIYDFWTPEKNYIIVNDVFAKEPTDHKLGHIPALIVAVGATPPIQTLGVEDTIKYQGESIYGDNRNIYDFHNRIMTYRNTIAGQAAHTPYAVGSVGGKKGLAKSPYYKGAEIKLDVAKEEYVKKVLEPSLSVDVDKLAGEVHRDITEGGISPILQGMDIPSGSGYRANILMHAASSVLEPRKVAIERGIAWLGRELLTQYAQGNFKELKLHGRDGSNEYFEVELTPENVKGDWFPEVKLLPRLPEDEHARVADAKVLVESELISPETAMDRYLGIRDTDLEQSKIVRAKAKKLPSVLIREMAMELAKDGRPDLAIALMEEFQARTQVELEGQAPKRGGKYLSEKEPPKEPEFATGYDRSVLPSEERGKIQGQA